jgi:hypothetical protein
MKFIFSRRYRHSSSSREKNFFKKESREQSFFGDPAGHHSFIQPASSLLRVQRKSNHEGKEDKKLQPLEVKKEDDKKLMRAGELEEKLQKKASDPRASISIPTPASSGYKSSGSGQPLSQQEQWFFRQRLGVDFNQVKIHTGPNAAIAANAVNAKAFTVGNDIVLNEGQYQPATEDGKKLLAHELVHVVQNGRGKSGAAISRQARPRRIRPQRTTAQLLDALMQPGSPLWRQLNPDESSPVNCPATAAAVDEYLGTGRVSPAAGGDALSNFEFNTRPMTGPYTSFGQIRNILSAERSFAVIRAVRTPEYLQSNPGITRDHFFTAVNYRGQVVLIDAYGRGAIVSDVASFLSQEGFGTYYLYNGQFRVRHIRFDDAPDL